jgi:nucleotide-binding universal stress UspA family protein
MSAPVKHLGIVVAVDDSPASNAATCWAAREAAMRNHPLKGSTWLPPPPRPIHRSRTPNL